MGYLIGLAIVVGVCVLGYQVVLMLSFNLALLLDGTLPFASHLPPSAAWLLTGALAGAMVGVYRSGRRFSAPYLRPLAIVTLLVLTAAIGQNVYAFHQARARRAPAERPVAAPLVRYATVIASGGANLRAQPSMSGARIATLPHGARVGILSGSGEWYKVRFVAGATARQGFMHASVLRLE